MQLKREECNMITYLFYDSPSGETFCVEEKTLDDAKKIANKYFDKPRFIEVISEDEAEAYGYDTY
jgi:hypothetical protein